MKNSIIYIFLFLCPFSIWAQSDSTQSVVYIPDPVIINYGPTFLIAQADTPEVVDSVDTAPAPDSFLIKSYLRVPSVENVALIHIELRAENEDVFLCSKDFDFDLEEDASSGFSFFRDGNTFILGIGKIASAPQGVYLYEVRLINTEGTAIDQYSGSTTF